MQKMYCHLNKFDYDGKNNIMYKERKNNIKVEDAIYIEF